MASQPIDLAQFSTILAICAGLVVLITPILSGLVVFGVMKYRLGQQEKQTSANTALIDTVATHVQLLDVRFTRLEERHHGIEGTQSATTDDLKGVEKKIDRLSADVAYLRGAAESGGGRRVGDK